MKSSIQGRLKLTKLVLTGENKQDAIIDFKDGLNVIAGASDTGKSFAFECIDYALGSSSKLKEVPEVDGYQSVFLEIEDIGRRVIFTIERGIPEEIKNKMTIYYSNYQDKDRAKNEKMSSKHSAKTSLSKKLLNYCGCTYKNVKKSEKEVQSFTFRSFNPLIMISELRITATYSPIYRVGSRGSTSATSEKSVFKTVISGVDYEKKEKKENIEIAKAKLKGKIEQLKQIIDEMRLENNELINGVEDIKSEKSTEIIELNKFIKEKTDEIKKYEVEYKNIQAEIELENTELKRLLNNNNKFKLLKENYLSDLERLEFINDAFDLTQQLVEVECPICHSPMKINEIEKSDDYYEALVAEKLKIEVQLTELDKTIKDLSDEIMSKEENISKLENHKDDIKDNLNNKLGPIVAEKVKQVQNLMEIQEKINLVTRNKKRMDKYYTKINEWKEKIDTTGKEKGNKKENLPDEYTNELCKEIKCLLKECDFISEEDAIKYNNTINDIEIGEKEKASFGKGARAIINSTFLIGLMNYCYKKNLCHPGFVILDSPLTTYKEKDKKDGGDENITKGTKEKFYEMLAEQKNGQIIIFDNEEPSSTVKKKINYLHFSGDSSVGRKGLIP